MQCKEDRLMMPAFVGKWFGRWAEPIGGLQGPLAVALRVLAIILRLYAAYTFIQYGYDKLFGGNKVYAMDANFFRALGVPLPEVTQVMIGGLEFFGGLLLLVGLFTRLFAFF